MKIKPFILLCAVMLVLVACGKKPSFVDAPAGQESDFPAPYPKPLPNPGE